METPKIETENSGLVILTASNEAGGKGVVVASVDGVALSGLRKLTESIGGPVEIREVVEQE